jgi:UPF0755 protein
MNEYQIEEPSKGFKRIVLLIGGLIAVGVLVVAIYYFTKVNRAASSESREVSFMVEKGSRTKTVAVDLENKKIISNKWIFIVYATLHGAGGKIQAGAYQLNSNMPITDIMDVLTHGRVVSTARSLTIIEGWNNKQITDYLTQRNIVKSKTEFDNALSNLKIDFDFTDVAKKNGYQGFLFPDTYKLAKDQGVDILVDKMVSNFQTKYTQARMNANVGAVTSKQSYDYIIMASIIEKEVGRNKEVITKDDLAAMQRERELVASVFYNRLKAGMPLESDATVNYITGKADRSVTIADTKIKSPYNTYQVRGLPPTPISNPGIGSIQASISPIKSDYLYFLNAPDGTAYFAKTLAEHNANKAKYLK